MIHARLFFTIPACGVSAAPKQGQHQILMLKEVDSVVAR